MKPNILFYLAQFPGLGGIEVVTHLLANYFAESGYPVTICSYLSNTKIDLRSKIHSGIQLVQLPHGNPLDHPENLNALKNLFANNHFSVVLFQDSYATIERHLFCVLKKYPTPLITVEHNKPLSRNIHRVSSEHRWNIFAVRKKIGEFRYWHLTRPLRQRTLFLKSTRYVLLSDRFLPELCKLVHIRDTKGKVLAQGNPLRFVRSENSVPPKEKSLLFAGTICYRKGIDRLLDIWEILSPEFPDWNFYIVGEGPELEWARTQVNLRKISQIHLTGAKSDMAPVYQKSSFLLMASDFEGWGMVLTEAMQWGCLPIAFDSYQSLHDIIDDNINGYIIPAFQKELYCQRLRNAMVNYSTLEQMRIAAIMKTQQFSISHIGKWWKALIEDVVR